MTERNRGTTSPSHRSIPQPLIGGILAALLGVIITWLVSQTWETPWSLIEVLIAVALASFFASAGTAYGMTIDRTR